MNPGRISFNFIAGKCWKAFFFHKRVVLSGLEGIHQLPRSAPRLSMTRSLRYTSMCVVLRDSTLAYNITVDEEAAHFCWSKDWGSAMVSKVTMSMDNVESLRLRGGELLTAGGAEVDVTAKLKAGFCQSSCCC